MSRVALHELQVIDGRIGGLQRELADLPEKKSLNGKLGELNRLGKIAADKRQLLFVGQTEQKDLELAVEQLGQKIAAKDKRLYEGRITSPKELKSIEDEVKLLRGKRDTAETRLIEKIEAVEGLAAEVTELESALQQVRAEADLAQAAFEEASLSMEQQLSQLNAQREEVLKSVSPDALKLYDRLRHEKVGLAVATVDGSTCGACHMELPAEELERAIGEEQVWRCPHCRRILVRR